MTRFRAFGAALGLSLSFVSFAALATELSPPCMVRDKQLNVNNAQVSKWKTTTKNQYLGRGHVTGRISRLYGEKTGHAHFQMEFDRGVDDTLEVVYSLDFGKLPKLAIGMQVEACGDYITSSKNTSRYPRSPDGAIIHWVHRSDSPAKHASGYLILDGRVFGGGGGVRR